MTSPKVLISDLDGTLCSDEREISPQTYNALDRLLDKRVSLAIATARPLGYLKFSIPGSLLGRVWKICHNGAQLFDPDDSMIFQHSIDLSVQKELVSELAGRCASISWYSGDRWLTDENFSDEHRHAYGISPDYPAPLAARLSELKHTGAVKILVVGATGGEDIVKRYSGRTSVYKSRSADLLMISSGNADKATAAAHLLESVSGTWSETMVLGDDMNDACLFEKAGVAVAMADAPEDLKRMAHHHGGSNNDPSSISAILETFLDRAD